MAVNAFLYPRTIAVHRPNVDTTVGADTDYSGTQESDETLVATGVRCSIQYDAGGRNPEANLPADAQGRATWKVLIPLEQAAFGTIRRNDVIVDDLGVRYQVRAPYWNSLGYNVKCETLEV